MEKALYPKEGGTLDPSINEASAYGETEPSGTFSQRFIDSFKRDPNAHVTKHGQVGADGSVFDSEAAAQATANSPLQRRLKGRHLQMIAIGGSIGKLGRSGKTSRMLLIVVCVCRNWSVRCLGICSVHRWSRVCRYCVYSHRYDVVLHCPCLGRNGCPVSCRRFVRCVLDPFH